MTPLVTKVPTCEISANLQPLEYPGSIPKIAFPFKGVANKRCFRFVLKTSQEALSAFCFNSDLTSRLTSGSTIKKNLIVVCAKF